MLATRIRDRLTWHIRTEALHLFASLIASKNALPRSVLYNYQRQSDLR